MIRSFLFVPGHDEKKIIKALGTTADAVILDLEDSVSLEQKPAGRLLVAEILAAPPPSRAQIFVRLNPLSTREGWKDLEVLSAGSYDGIVQPKAEGSATILELFNQLPEKKPILAIATETAQALFKLNDYGAAASYLLGITWGAEDLSSALGAEASRDSDGFLTDPYRLARSLCLFAAKSINREAIDTVFVDFKDKNGLARECREAVRDGFTGKMAIHPDQVEVINTIFTPSEQEIAHAQNVVDAFAKSDNAGVLALEGKMYDLPHKTRCEKILARAARYGVLAPVRGNH